MTQICFWVKVDHKQQNFFILSFVNTIRPTGLHNTYLIFDVFQTVVKNHKSKRISQNHCTDYEEIFADSMYNVVEHHAELSPNVPDPARDEDQLDPTKTNPHGNDSPEYFYFYFIWDQFWLNKKN